jgi:adenylosuccinate synthase
MDRLDKGQKGILEVAQGFPLSLNYKFHPACTNRNVTVSAALDGMFIPPIYAGNVILNYRTFPIRISSFKYIGDNGKFLTWAEVEEYNKLNKKYEIYKGDSGGWYEDQKEVDWDYITKISGSVNKIMEITSVTKLPRRVATFSKIGFDDSIRYNRTGHDVFVSINFMNYVDGSIAGIRGNQKLTDKVSEWLNEYVYPISNKYGAKVAFIGTGAKTDDKIQLI